MTLPKAQHSTFVIERQLPGSPRHAFRFWSDPALKARWNSCHADWTTLEDHFDFRVGGSETKRWRTPEGDELSFHAAYLDIEDGRRLIYAYEMAFNGQRLSASLVTVELAAGAGGAVMTFTEQTAFLAGDAAREERIAGTEEGFDRLVAAIAEEAQAVA